MDQQQLDLPGVLGDTGVPEDVGEDGKGAAAPNRGELHVHMNGAIPTSEIRKILLDEATVLPAGFELEHGLVRKPPATRHSNPTPLALHQRLP